MWVRVKDAEQRGRQQRKRMEEWKEAKEPIRGRQDTQRLRIHTIQPLCNVSQSHGLCMYVCVNVDFNPLLFAHHVKGT